MDPMERISVYGFESKIGWYWSDCEDGGVPRSPTWEDYDFELWVENICQNLSKMEPVKKINIWSPLKIK